MSWYQLDKKNWRKKLISIHTDSDSDMNSYYESHSEFSHISQYEGIDNDNEFDRKNIKTEKEERNDLIICENCCSYQSN